VDNDEVLLRLMKLMASAHVAHNLVQIPLGLGFVYRMPLAFTWFEDGLAVTAASADFSSALGARVLSIGGRTPEQLKAELAPYISFENEHELRVSVPHLIPAEGVLKHLGLIESDRTVAVRVQKPGGESIDLKAPIQLGNVKKVGIYDGLPVTAPFYNSHPGAVYWQEFLADSGTLYIQYNQCRSDAKDPFPDFSRRVMADADSHTVKRVVIDLRQNGGGNSRIIGPLKSGLAARLKSVGNVYVFIGPNTFSSAVDNAIELQRDLKATLVGAPSGGMPEGYGEVAYIKLPNSKLTVQITTKRWGPENATGPVTLTPKIAAPLRLADILASRDPALDAVTAIP
jgi:hypothetical protein